ncbi:MAG: DUF448 domain-containing protein [Rhodobacteraceae bacterium]|nr:DUF448 domain-containing protein [Paracoccaceae bacterium]
MTRGKSRRREKFVRRCLVTKRRESQDGMIRFVTSPEGTVVPDVDRVLPGRGMWLVARRDVLERAIAGNHFSRATRQRVRSSHELADLVDRSLVSRLCRHIALARKSGAAVAGSMRVRQALGSGAAGLLLLATDGSPGQIGRIRPESDCTVACRCLSGSELGVAFAQDSVIQAFIRQGGFVRTLSGESRRLRSFRLLGEDRELAAAMRIPAKLTNRLRRNGDTDTKT